MIQTFLSEDYSEEIQIRGRTARQGKKGRFVLVLDCEVLSKSFSLAPDALAAARGSSRIYEILHNARNAAHKKHSEERQNDVERASADHEESEVLQKALLQYRSRPNPGAAAELASRLCRFDAKASSSSRKSATWI